MNSAWADDYVFCASNKNSSTASGSWVFTDGGKTWTMTCGSEGYATGSSNKSDYLKMNRNKTWTVSIPTGLRVTKFKVQGWQNASSGTSSTKISNVNGTDVDYALPLSNADEASYTYNFSTAATESFTFTISGDKQVLVKYTITAEEIPTGPTINTQPQSATYVTGASASALIVSATTSGGDLSYQWYSNNTGTAAPATDTAIEGATNASYTPSTASAGTTYYYCVVTDDNGPTTSSVATITVSTASAPTISVSGAPVSDIVTGTEVTLTATMTGVPSPTIQWYSNTTASTSDGTEIVGASNEIYTPSTATTGTYYFYAVATNSQGNATSEVQTLVVKDKVATPTFTPNGAYFDGASQSVTIACATDDATIQYSTDNGDTWNNYSAAFNVTATTTIKAKATKDGLITSDEASATFTKVVLDERVDVTGVSTWDWSKFGTKEIKLTTSTTPAKDAEFVLSNVVKYGLCASIGNDFGNAQQLKVRTEYVVRDTKYFQGPYIKFNTTVPGKLSVTYSNTGNNPTRYLNINGTNYGEGTGNSTMITTSDVAVAAGEVTITGALAPVGDAAPEAGKYLRISKIIFTPVVKATIGSYGYATLSSQFDMDFTGGVEGLTAYKAASATKSTITLEEVTGEVKAGDGLVIKGTAGTYTIPTTTGASTIYDAPETINMFGCDGSWSTVSKAGSGTNFVLSVQDGKVVFAPVINTAASLSAGQAGLWANISVDEARALRISFGDDATGVNDVRGNMDDVRGDVYDLQGRRVAQPTKGLYIVNGRKVVIK